MMYIRLIREIEVAGICGIPGNCFVLGEDAAARMVHEGIAEPICRGEYLAYLTLKPYYQKWRGVTDKR